VQRRSEADASAEVLWVGRDRNQPLGRGFEQDAVDHDLVVIGNIGDGRRHCEHHVVIGHGQELGVAVGQPLLGSRGLALRTVPIAAGIVRDAQMSAGLTAFDMIAQRRGSAALDCRT
jgi:hypothetical protein